MFEMPSVFSRHKPFGVASPPLPPLPSITWEALQYWSKLNRLWWDTGASLLGKLSPLYLLTLLDSWRCWKKVCLELPTCFSTVSLLLVNFGCLCTSAATVARKC